MRKEVHVLGPLLPPGYACSSSKTQNGEEGTSVDIETFLGEMLVQHGERSVFFVRRSFFFLLLLSNLDNKNFFFFFQISFGSFFWPPVPEYVEELIEALIVKKTPFVQFAFFTI